MARGWDTQQDTLARARAASDTPNIAALEKAVARAGQWTVEDVLTELGGTGKDATHRLAEKILTARGVDISEKSVRSQQRSINRWIAYERGSGAQSRKPSKAMQQILNRIGKNAQMARDGFTVAMSGDISVAGYRRADRTATVHMQGDEAARWLESPNFEDMGQFYGGNDLAGYGDLQVQILS